MSLPCLGMAAAAAPAHIVYIPLSRLGLFAYRLHAVLWYVFTTYPCTPVGAFFASIVTCFAAWTSTSVFASHDAKIVFRSAGMLGYPTGFRYKEVMRHKVRRRNQFCVESKSRFSTGRPRNQPTPTRSSLRMKYSRRSISWS